MTGTGGFSRETAILNCALLHIHDHSLHENKTLKIPYYNDNFHANLSHVHTIGSHATTVNIRYVGN